MVAGGSQEPFGIGQTTPNVVSAGGIGRFEQILVRGPGCASRRSIAEIELEFHPGQHHVPTLGAQLACTGVQLAGPRRVTQTVMDPRRGGMRQRRVGVLTGGAICELASLGHPGRIGVMGMIERHLGQRGQHPIAARDPEVEGPAQAVVGARPVALRGGQPGLAQPRQRLLAAQPLSD